MDGVGGGSSVSTNSFWGRPRCLYAVVFIWISITGGRFLSPFLQQKQEEDEEDEDASSMVILSDTKIGILLALHQATSVMLSSWAGSLADVMEQQQIQQRQRQQQERFGDHSSVVVVGGRAKVLSMGALLGGLVFWLHGIHHLLPQSQFSFWNSFVWYAILRVGYAMATCMIFPVMDGMCLDYLQKLQKQQEQGVKSSTTTKTSTSKDYGKERLYGAITWAITHVLLGPCLDNYGFWILYPLSIVSTMLVLLVVYLFDRSTQQHEHEQLQKNHVGLAKRSSNIQTRNDDDDDDPGDESVKHNVTGGNEDFKRLLAQPSHVHHNSPEPEEESSSMTTTTTTTSPISLLKRMLPCLSWVDLAFLVAILALQSGQAVVDNMVFLFFESSLGSSFSMMGWTVVLTVAFEIPIFQVAPQLLDTCGTTMLIKLAAISYMVRVVGYSLIPHGKVAYVLWLEPFHGVTYACSATAGVEFMSNLVPQGCEASGQGLLQVVVGMGSVFGLFFGGWAEERLGPRLMYRISAMIVLGGTIILAMAVYCQQRRCGRGESRESICHRHDMASVDDDTQKQVEMVVGHPPIVGES